MSTLLIDGVTVHSGGVVGLEDGVVVQGGELTLAPGLTAQDVVVRAGGLLDGGGGLVEGQHEQVEGAEAAEDADDAEGPDGPEDVGHARLGKEEGDDREKDNCRICYVIGKKMGW